MKFEILLRVKINFLWLEENFKFENIIEALKTLNLLMQEYTSTLSLRQILS